MILAPCSLASVGIEVGPGDVMVRADFHPAKAREVGLSLIGARAVIGVGERVINAPRLPSGVQVIPARRFVGMDSREGIDHIANHRNRVAFMAHNKRKGAATAFTHHNNALALAGLIDGKATVPAILLSVLGRT